MARQIFTQDKEGRVSFNNHTGTIDAVLAPFLNGSGQFQVEWPASTDKPIRPTGHRYFDFVGRKTPTGTDYPDSVAPIGSTYTKFLDTGSTSVTSVRRYLKNNANTWISISPHTRNIDQLAGTVLVNGALTAAYAISLDGFTASTGWVGEGTVLSIGGVTTIVLEDTPIASNAANNIPVSVAITAANNAAVTITSYNAVSTDDTIICDSTGAAMTIVLPPVATSKGAKLRFISKNDSSTNTITIDGSGSELINGAATIVMNVIYESVTVQCDGIKWYNFMTPAT